MGALTLAWFSILVWSTLAYLGTRLGHLPPLLSVGIALTMGGMVGLPWVRSWRVPFSTFALGVGGIFGYHLLLFTAFRLAPAVEVNLLQYLWPLLIVALSPLFLPGSRLGFHHVLGSLLGLVGAGLVVTGGHLHLESTGLPGYLLALAAAFTWASYSLLTKRVRPFATGAVGGFCLVSGLLSLALFVMESSTSIEFLRTIRPMDWVFLGWLGAGPMGMAFYAWDASLKRGDPRVIGSLAYLTPLLSTLVLVVLGGRSLSAISIVAMTLIVLGAAIGSMSVRRDRNLTA